jgi:putative membrane protein
MSTIDGAGPIASREVSAASAPIQNRAEAPRPPVRLTEIGSEPDPRFTYANERTFLAWIRTALALVAAGLGAAQFLSLDPAALRLAVALPLIALGAVAASASYARWERSERALRLGEPLPYSTFMRTVAFGVAVVSVLCAVLAILDLAAN